MNVAARVAMSRITAGSSATVAESVSAAVISNGREVSVPEKGAACTAAALASAAANTAQPIEG